MDHLVDIVGALVVVQPKEAIGLPLESAVGAVEFSLETETPELIEAPTNLETVQVDVSNPQPVAQFNLAAAQPKIRIDKIANSELSQVAVQPWDTEPKISTPIMRNLIEPTPLQFISLPVAPVEVSFDNGPLKPVIETPITATPKAIPAMQEVPDEMVIVPEFLPAALEPPFDIKMANLPPHLPVKFDIPPMDLPFDRETLRPKLVDEFESDFIKPDAAKAPQDPSPKNIGELTFSQPQKPHLVASNYVVKNNIMQNAPPESVFKNPTEIPSEKRTSIQAQVESEKVIPPAFTTPIIKLPTDQRPVRTAPSRYDLPQTNTPHVKPTAHSETLRRAPTPDAAPTNAFKQHAHMAPEPSQNTATGIEQQSPTSLEVIKLDPIPAAQNSTPAQKSAYAARAMEIIVTTAGTLSNKPAEITLNPEELGRVRLSLKSTDNVMAVVIMVERPETLELLRRHIDLFAADLGKLGYDGMSFEFAEQEGDFQDNPEEEPQHSSSNLTDQTQPNNNERQRYRAMSGANAGIDIRL